MNSQMYNVFTLLIAIRDSSMRDQQWISMLRSCGSSIFLRDQPSAACVAICVGLQSQTLLFESRKSSTMSARRSSSLRILSGFPSKGMRPNSCKPAASMTYSRNVASAAVSAELSKMVYQMNHLLMPLLSVIHALGC